MGHDTRVRREVAQIRRRAWGNYLGALILNAFVPLLPLLVELILHRGVSTSALLVTSIVYLLTVAATSETVLPMVSYIVVSVLFAVLYGVWLVAPGNLSGGEVWMRGSIGGAVFAAMVTQGFDRWKMHMVNNVPCFPFMKES